MRYIHGCRCVVASVAAACHDQVRAGSELNSTRQRNPWQLLFLYAPMPAWHQFVVWPAPDHHHLMANLFNKTRRLVRSYPTDSYWALSGSQMLHVMCSNGSYRCPGSFTNCTSAVHSRIANGNTMAHGSLTHGLTAALSWHLHVGIPLI